MNPYGGRYILRTRKICFFASEKLRMKSGKENEKKIKESQFGLIVKATGWKSGYREF